MLSSVGHTAEWVWADEGLQRVAGTQADEAQGTCFHLSMAAAPGLRQASHPLQPQFLHLHM